jgi:MFS transporter, ACS family, glucarate transporter
MKPSNSTCVRWRIVSLLSAFSIVGYVVRVNITVAAEPIMREFGLSSLQLGWIFSAFLLTYTALNMPSGAWADRWGPRRMLAVAGLGWFALTLLTAWLPGRGFSSIAGVLGTFVLLRLLLGVSEAPTYSSAAKSIAAWLPVSERAFANGLVMGAALLGSAITGPAFSALMVRAGWRTAMATSSLVVPVLVAVWWAYARDYPQEHRDVNRTELQIIESGTTVAEPMPTATGGWRDLLRSGQAWTLFSIYGCQTYLGYLFIWWCYIYLVEVRHFSLVRGGFASAAPFLLATFTTPAGGALSDRLIGIFGWRRGRQMVPMAALSAAGVLAFAGVRVGNAHLAIALLSVGAALGWMCEGPTWAAMMDIAGPVAGAAGGFLNTGGNIGGVFAALLTPWIAKELSWSTAFGAATLLALTGAVLWTCFDPKHPVTRT